MASILALPQPPSMPPHNSSASEGNHSDSWALSPEWDNAMQVENHPPRTLQAPQQSNNPVGDDTPQPPPQSTDPQGVHISDIKDDERLKVDRFFYETVNMQGTKESKSQLRGIFEQSVSKINDLVEEIRTVLMGKKYKPVALKVKLLYQELPEKFRVKRNITGDPLKDMPVLDPNPPDQYFSVPPPFL